MVNTMEDGDMSTAPVDAYESNGYGLYNVSENVWEWCENTKTSKGGLYQCHHSYCNRYRVTAKSSNTVEDA